MPEPIRIRAVDPPATPNEPPAAVLRDIEAIDDANDIGIWGFSDTGFTARSLAGSLAMQRHDRVIVLAAWLAGEERAAGYGAIVMPRTGQTRLAEFSLIVAPDRRRRGIGRALLAAIERVAAEHDRTILATWSQCTPEPGADDPDALTPPTGFGRARRSDPATRFALAAGFGLDQVERHSVLRPDALPARPEVLYADAERHAGGAYRLHQWSGRTPERLRAGIAELTQRMSTDVPRGQVDFGESDWDAAKVAYAADVAEAEGREQLYTAVEHVPSGQIAGYTNLWRFAERGHAAMQDNTIVAPAHRGRRLGMLVKAANLRQMMARWPDVERLHTWNAEENLFMLAINVALGFEPVGTDAMWVRETAAG